VPFVSKRPDDITGLVNISESKLVEKATAEGVRGLDFFGGEPTLHYEYVLEVSRLCREKGIVTFLNTNGFINPGIAEQLAEAVDYPIVGIKGAASPSLYGKFGAKPQAVLDALKVFHDTNPRTWITYLDGPGLGATHEDLERFAAWVHDNIGPKLEVHVGRLLQSAPTYQDEYETVGDPYVAAIRTSRMALELAENGLRNVWITSGGFELKDVLSGRTKPGVI
jgi:pyruvate formate lyase activating enzyme